LARASRRIGRAALYQRIQIINRRHRIHNKNATGRRADRLHAAKLRKARRR
jgi:hypothetical protein